jgi:hypothetical protein
MTHNHAFFGPWPHESPPFQALGKQAQPIAVPPQQLDQITAAAAEAKQLTRERILPEHRLRLCRRTAEIFAHVGGARRQP